ncbi:hypothetical protein V8E36_007879 [Tilletia maclaganii]
MSGARTITAFLIDISPSMGTKTRLKQTVFRQEKQLYEEEEIELSFVELAGELVCLKLKEAIFADLKTNKTLIMTFGSPRTNNITNSEQGGYEGIDVIWPTAPPTLDTIDIVRKLRAARPGQAAKKADPLDALVVAISTMLNPEQGGLRTTNKDTWTRNIYLITDAAERMNRDELESIKDALFNQKVGLKVVGVNFDDDNVNFHQPNKPRVKLENEHFWHEFLSDVPECGVASLDYVYQDNLRPEVRITNSTMKKSTLTLGNPDHSYNENYQDEEKYLVKIAIKVGKLTAIARPITQRKISRPAQINPAIQQAEAAFGRGRASAESGPSATPNRPDLRQALRAARAAADEVQEVSAHGVPIHSGEVPSIPTYAIKNRKIFFLAKDLTGIGSEKEERSDAVPLSGARREELPNGKHRLVLTEEDDEPDFVRGWRLGQTYIPISDDLYTDPKTTAGIEIIQFYRKAFYQDEPYLKFGEVYYVTADDKDFEAQIQLSAFAKAMAEMKRWALVRWVKTDNSAQLLGALLPISTEGTNFFQLVSLPFANDVRGWQFPPLTRVIDKLGNTVYDHPSLPTERMEALTDRLIDSMDLANVEEDGETYEFGPPDDLLNPYIHRLKQDVVNRAMHPDRPLLAPHEELIKNFQPPPSVLAALADVVNDMNDEGILPQHRARTRPPKSDKRRHSSAPVDGGDAEDEIDVDQGGSKASKRKSEDSPKAKKPRLNDDDDDRGSDGTAPDQMSVDGRAEDGHANDSTARGIRIDLENPVADFQREIEAAVESSVMEDGAGVTDGDSADAADESATNISLVLQTMGRVIWRLTEPRFKRKGASDAADDKLDHEKARECIRAYRSTAIKMDEAKHFNKFIRNLKASTNQSTRSFWDRYIKGNADCGLISSDEDLADSVNIDEAEAKEFIDT